jgi:hypothetical protein
MGGWYDRKHEKKLVVVWRTIGNDDSRVSRLLTDSHTTNDIS